MRNVHQTCHIPVLRISTPSKLTANIVRGRFPAMNLLLAHMLPFLVSSKITRPASIHEKEKLSALDAGHHSVFQLQSISCTRFEQGSSPVQQRQERSPRHVSLLFFKSRGQRRKVERGRAGWAILLGLLFATMAGPSRKQ